MQPSEARAHHMLHRIFCHLELDQQQDWTLEIGQYDYVYADTESEVEAIKLWEAYNLGDQLPEPRYLLQFLRVAMIENEGNADERASRIMLYYQSSLGLNDGSIFRIPNRQTPRSAIDIVSPLLLRWTLDRLEAHDIFNPDINTDLLRECKAQYRKYLVSAPYMLKKDSFVLFCAMVLWAPNNIKSILKMNGIICEKGWLDGNHTERLFQMYTIRTWEAGGMEKVRESYRALRHYLHSVHENENLELTRPAAFRSAEDEDNDGDLQRVHNVVEEMITTSSRDEINTSKEHGYGGDTEPIT
ncbi:hypothetical protein PTMSG1_05261 [Pyrenophora teres f. maculata]|nr:hypothetical protein PTMSG1_05261 [Pyrenophora teres f. maculata]